MISDDQGDIKSEIDVNRRKLIKMLKPAPEFCVERVSDSDIEDVDHHDISKNHVVMVSREDYCCNVCLVTHKRTVSMSLWISSNRRFLSGRRIFRKYSQNLPPEDSTLSDKKMNDVGEQRPTREE